MQLYIVIAIIAIVVLFSTRSLWDRFDSGGVEDWMLEVEGLEGLCRDYLDYVKDMSSGRYDTETIRYLDSQRQVTHDQILYYLGLDRSHPLDMTKFARRYLNQ